MNTNTQPRREKPRHWALCHLDQDPDSCSYIHRRLEGKPGSGGRDSEKSRAMVFYFLDEQMSLKALVELSMTTGGEAISERNEK